jgi:hypothetical protein
MAWHLVQFLGPTAHLTIASVVVELSMIAGFPFIQMDNNVIEGSL